MDALPVAAIQIKIQRNQGQILRNHPTKTCSIPFHRNHPARRGLEVEKHLNPRAKIILLSTCAAMVYGILHDQITARVCVEYFSIAHPALFPTASPTLLALGWGVTATLGAGLVFGVLLARASQSAGRPPMPIAKLVRPIAVWLAIMALAATLAGFVGFELARRSLVVVPLGWADLIPPAQHHRFAAVWFAHSTSYAVGIIGGTRLILHIWNKRLRPPILPAFPKRRPELVRAVLLVVALSLIIWLRFGP
jgi:hypothetical protein